MKFHGQTEGRTDMDKTISLCLRWGITMILDKIPGRGITMILDKIPGRGITMILDKIPVKVLQH